MRFLKRKILVVALVALTAFAVSGGLAFAVFPADSITHFTGCLNTSASPGGTFVNVAQGENPSRACGKGQVVAHLSGGDITTVQTASGSGLTGGTDNGAASLALDSSGCSTDGLLKWNGNSWYCGTDNNAGGTITGVSAGTGLTGGGTSGNVSLALGSGYQLPQNCGSGQVPKSNGAGGWSCQSDENTQLHAYTATGGIVNLDNTATVTMLNIPNDPGPYVIIATQTLTANGDGQADCRLILNGNELALTGEQVPGGDGNDGSLTETAATELTVPGRIQVDCTSNNNPDQSQINGSSIVALRVGSIN